MSTVMVVFGTRPEAIKLSPVIQALDAHSDIDRVSVIVTGQHRELLDPELVNADITPDANLDVMSPDQSLTRVATRVIEGVAEQIEKIKPDFLVVQGDTTTALAAALAGFYNQVPIGHVEAGLRTGRLDNPFPEEGNRCLVTSIAALHFAPTEHARGNLLREGVADEMIKVTGNTIVDAVHATLSDNYTFQDEELESLLDPERKIVVITLHRRESFGEPIRNILKAVLEIGHRHPEIRVVLPVHFNPNVRDEIYRHLDGQDHVHLVEPIGYQDFLHLLSRASFILTDSGGIQEEAPSLGKPVLVLRETTERPEIIEAGGALLVGTDPETILEAVGQLLSDSESYDRMANAPNPFGDGHAGENIAEAVAQYLIQ